MDQDKPLSEPNKPVERQHDMAEFIKVVLGIVTGMYLLVLFYVFVFNIRYSSPFVLIVVYYEIVLVVYFILLLALVHKGGENFRLRYAFLSLAILITAIFLFGFNASFSSPGENLNPWQWNIGNEFGFLVAYPVSSILITMVVGTLSLIVIRLKSDKVQLSTT